MNETSLDSPSVLLGLLVLFAFFVHPGIVRSITVEEAIVHGRYSKAKKMIQSVKARDETLFLKALIAFRRGRYTRAEDRFSRLVDEFPDSSRARDASYYLDRLKLYSPSTEPPTVRVQIGRDSEFSGSIAGSAVLLRNGSDTITVLNGGQDWTVGENYTGTYEFSVAGESYSFEQETKMVIRPLRKGTELTYQDNAYRGTFVVLRKDNSFTLVNRLPMNYYLYGVVRKEIAPEWPMETIKAQAVASRSYALHKIRGERNTFDLKSSHLAQVYGGKSAETERVRRAVETTRGQVLTFSDRVVPAYFHANSGGYIETASSVWNNGRSPFIVSKPDTWSKNTQHSTWEASVSLRSLERSLQESGYPEPGVNPSIRIDSRLESGRTRTISYRTDYENRKAIRTSDFRMAIGPNKLRSTWIRSVNNQGSVVVFRGRGWGHGIGMSQWGAHSMGQAGVPYRKILKFYYERAKLMGQYGMETNRGGDDR